LGAPVERLRFDGLRRPRPAPSWLTVETTLAHFALVTFEVEPEALRPHVHERFELECIPSAGGRPMALVSVVPFLDLDFRFVRCPWPKRSFGQTNYRAYVVDRETGAHVVWFFGTVLDSLAVQVPRHAWKLPWHRARMRFETAYDAERGRYTSYNLWTESAWAPAELELEDSGALANELRGFPDLETGLVLLTHPLTGYFHRRDGRLGSYSVWHPALRPTEARVRSASFPLLERLGLVPDGDLSSLHSVLLQPAIDFTIYLPPHVVPGASSTA